MTRPNRIARQSRNTNITRSHRLFSPVQKWTLIIGSVLLFGLNTALLWMIRD